MGSALIQIMAWCLFGAKPLSKPMLGYCQFQLLGTNLNEFLIKIQNFSFTKMHLNILSAKWRPFCPGGNELTRYLTHNAITHQMQIVLLSVVSNPTDNWPGKAIFFNNRDEYRDLIMHKNIHQNLLDAWQSINAWTHRGRDEMAAILRTALWNSYPWMKMVIFWFWLKFHMLTELCSQGSNQ